MSEFFEILGGEVFAIAVAAFLLVRMEKKLDDLTTAILKLSARLDDGETPPS